MSEILLAEDNAADVYLIREALKQCGVDAAVRTATDGREFLELIATSDGAWRPDLIILDLNLPRHDGIEILQKLKSTETFAAVPVVVLTSSDSPRDRDAAIELGATRFLRKPSDLDQFLQLGEVFKELLTTATRSQGASI